MYCQEITNMWKPEITIEHCLQDMFPMKRQQKESQYSRCHKDNTRKGLWSGEDNEVPYANRDVQENIDLMDSWWDQYTWKQCLIVIDDFNAG